MYKMIFCMLILNSKSEKLIKNLLGEHGQKWVWPIWSQDSKWTDAIKSFFSCFYEFSKVKVDLPIKDGHGFLVQYLLYLKNE